MSDIDSRRRSALGTTRRILDPRLSGVIGVLVAVGMALGTGLIPARSAEPVRALRYGIPSSSNILEDILELENHGFIVGYSEARANPLWAAYLLFDSDFSSAVGRVNWQVDSRTRSKVSPLAFTNTGYDRGHMAPNPAIAHCYGVEGQADTFLMSNVCPQASALNQGVWQQLENTVKEYAQAFEEVWVFTGPYFNEEAQYLMGKDADSGGKGDIEVPDGFFKIMVDEMEAGRYPRVLALLIPQDADQNASLDTFLVSIDEVELLTGLDFLVALPVWMQNLLESATLTQLWQIPDA